MRSSRALRVGLLALGVCLLAFTWYAVWSLDPHSDFLVVNWWNSPYSRPLYALPPLEAGILIGVFPMISQKGWAGMLASLARIIWIETAVNVVLVLAATVFVYVALYPFLKLF